MVPKFAVEEETYNNIEGIYICIYIYKEGSFVNFAWRSEAGNLANREPVNPNERGGERPHSFKKCTHNISPADKI